MAANLLALGVATAILIAVMELGFFGLRALAPAGYWEIPALTGPVKLLGLAAGILLIAGRFDQAYFDLHRLFLPESQWNLSLGAFLGDRANPFDYGLGQVIARLSDGEPGQAFRWGIVLAVILLVAVMLLPFAFWVPGDAGRGLLTVLLQAALVAYAVIYLICLLMWTLYLLNFWTFAVLLAIFQYYRHRA